MKMFTWIDSLVLVFYLLLSVAIGLWVSRGKKSFKDYMFGGGSMPWVAVGISLIATSVSATTFLGAPADVFGADMTFLMFQFGAFISIFVIGFLFIPQFKKSGIQSAYELFEMRFSRSTRRLAAIFYCLHLLLRTGILLYAPSIVLSRIMGVDIRVAILISAVIAIFYTWFGGIKAVIWTDVMQFVVFFGGGIVVLIFIAQDVGGFSSMMDLASQHGKTKWFDPSLDPSNARTLISAGLAYAVLETAIRGGDQQFVQRYLSCKSAGDANRSSVLSMVSTEESGPLLEIEAFDVSNGGNDTWFFMGTSISQMGIKQQDDDQSKTMADWIHEKYPQYNPAMLRGGIGCINSTEVVAHLSEYLAYAGNVKFWAIEMGTNDAWGGGDWNLEIFRKNMQTIIDSAKAHNIVPILARIIATDSAKAQWQINPKFLEAIDSLTVQNKLPKGPDLYTYFREHPELLASDGVHPNGETGGGHMIHQLWAEALYPLYENESGSGEVKIITQNTTHLKEQQVRVQGRTIRIIGALEPEFKVMLLNPIGQVLETHKIKSTDNVEFKTNAPIGNYILVIQGQNTAITTQVTIK
jgi:lysophospholipase L1-like esterase